MSAPNILVALDDPAIFAGVIRRRETFKAWRAFLASLFALKMSDEELAIFQRCTGRMIAPKTPFAVAWLIIGRRGGKSFVLALIAVFLAVSGDYAPFLAVGERGTIMITAVDRKQARVIMRYIKGILRQAPALAEMIENETAESIDLTNALTIEVATASFRSVRGYTIVCFLGDEAAYWPADEASASPDVEIVNAVAPAMATIPNAKMLIASSPYARRGVLWDAYRRHHGKDDAPELVWQADTRTMNPTVPESFIAAAYEDDPARAAAEYGALFRTDVESLFSREAILAVVVPGRHELAPMDGAQFVAYVDPSGGSADSFTLAIAHRGEGDRAIIDAVREARPPFSPDGVVQEFAELLALFNVSKVTGDRYAGEWPRERFKAHGIEYVVSEQSTSDNFRDTLPLLNSGRIELLDHPRLIAQLIGLERKTSRLGKDTISHPPGGHDDIATAVCGAALLAIGASSFDASYSWAPALGNFLGARSDGRRSLWSHPDLWGKQFI